MGQAQEYHPIGRIFRSPWLVIVALAISSLGSAGVAGLLVWRDHEDAIARASDRTSSISRLIIAHAEAAAAVADRILSIAVPSVSAWDQEYGPEAAAIADLLRRSVGENSVVASAAAIDAAGNVLLTSRTYPPKPLNVAERPFMKGHLAGLPNPVIMGDPVPGPISGKKRFTFSRAIRNPDGSIRIILNAAIETANFDILYNEVLNWPEAETGVYGFGGDILAQVDASAAPAQPFLKAVEEQISRSAMTAGTVILSKNGLPRLVSWSRSSEYPSLYSATSEPMSEVLRTWRSRTLATVVLVAVGNILLWALTFAAIKVIRANQAADLHELSTREIHHRLKNSLQLISSLIRMRTGRIKDQDARKTVEEILVDLQSVAEIHSLLQNLPRDGNIDLSESLHLLCENLRSTYHCQIKLTAAENVPINAAHATGLSIIINELITNAIKYGDGHVTVNCGIKADNLLLQVQNIGGKLSEGFVVGESGGFGLRAVKAMVKGMNGDVTAMNLPAGGVQFSISIPLAELVRT